MLSIGSRLIPFLYCGFATSVTPARSSVSSNASSASYMSAPCVLPNLGIPIDFVCIRQLLLTSQPLSPMTSNTTRFGKGSRESLQTAPIVKSLICHRIHVTHERWSYFKENGQAMYLGDGNPQQIGMQERQGEERW